jgi:hypothetical protein
MRWDGGVDIGDARRVLDGYLDAEWALTQAVLTDPDDAVVATRRREVEAFLHTGPGILLGPTIGRAPGQSAEEIAAGAGQLAEYVRRPLLDVVEVPHPLWGTVYAGYAGSQQAYTTGEPVACYVVAGTEAGPRIVSEYDADPFTGEWEHGGGVVVDLVGAQRGDLPSS